MSRLINLDRPRGEPVLVKGNEAAGEAAIRAGCRFFFGYPITPQSELPEYLSTRLPEAGGVYLQAESELAAINMVMGAGATGARVLTSSSSPGFSLMQEGTSWMCAGEVPAVIVNVVRGGPGLGNLGPSQGDYFQATRGGGHGDYRTIVLGPGNLQELVDAVVTAFDLADHYRNPVVILGDGVMGQMMEPVRYPEAAPPAPAQDWVLTGRRGLRPQRIIQSLSLALEPWELFNQQLRAKYAAIAAAEQYCELIEAEDAELVLVAYGTASRVCRSALQRARAEGLKVGLLRPISLWPFPRQAFEQVLGYGRVRAFLNVEMSHGQMVEDTQLAVQGRRPVHLYTRLGGMTPTPRDVLEQLRALQQEVTGHVAH